ncbi:MAG: hypothetical protein ABIH70_08850 [Chloroflexota bacterium]
MCMTCGCMMPENDMGNTNNITLETLRKAAKAAGARSIKQVMATMTKTYQKKVKDTPADSAPIQ